MRLVPTPLLLGLTLSNPTFGAARGGVQSGRRSGPAAVAAALRDAGQALHARGPGALFASAEAAAIDALAYAYLQGVEARDLARTRGGTISTVGSHYNYGKIQLGNPLTPHRIDDRFGPHEVARFHADPVSRDIPTNRANERLSRADRRSVRIVDPLHRPLYVLHPSLAMCAYSGEGSQRVEVANLRHRERTPSFAGN
jgi:hypothetical protein